MPKKKSPEPSDLKHNPFAALAPTASMPPAKKTGDAHVEVAPPSEAPSPRGKLVVRREKKGRKGKTVTRVQGLAPDALEDLRVRMKKKLGCGATVEDGDLVLLGNLVDRAAAFLRAEGYPEVVEGN